MTGLRLRHDQVRRQLPRTVRPIAGETVDSYLLRLAAANHLTAVDLAAHLGARSAKLVTTVALPALARASGQPAAVLARALPELGPNPPTIGRRTPPPRMIRSPDQPAAAAPPPKEPPARW